MMHSPFVHAANGVAGFIQKDDFFYPFARLVHDSEVVIGGAAGKAICRMRLRHPVSIASGRSEADGMERQERRGCYDSANQIGYISGLSNTIAIGIGIGIGIGIESRGLLYCSNSPAETR